ncbi:MAG: DUF504 domain-containing protein [Elusimicrobia bacterium]|nr:DUF504 domain-containing protein [Elusimicrobiota bacterium]
MTKLRDLLNRIIWDPSEKKEKDKYLITYRDGRIERDMQLDQITKVDGFGFTTFDDSYIPLHRIRAVRKGPEIIWRKNP